MGRVKTLTVAEHGGEPTYKWANKLRDDYVSQTDTEVQTLSGIVFVKPDSGSELIDTIHSYYDEKEIHIPKGTYALTDIIDSITLASDIHPRIVGAGSSLTTITSSETEVFDIANTAFLANKTHQIDIEGLTIEHDCQNATDKTLDLLNAQANLRDVMLVQKNATKQGIGFYCGRGAVQSPTGVPCKWSRVHATKYGTGFELGLDHLSLYNPIANICLNKGFYIHDLYDDSIYNGKYMRFYAPELFINTTAEHQTIYPFRFENPGYGLYFDDVLVENKEAITHEIFSRETATGGAVSIDGIHVTVSAGCTLSNSSIFQFSEKSKGLNTYNNGTVLLSGDGVATQFNQIASHGLHTTDISQIIVDVSPASNAARTASPVTGFRDASDTAKISVKFASAPANGSNNVRVNWKARARV